MRFPRGPRFASREIVRVRENGRTALAGSAGLLGVVCGMSRNDHGRWGYAVSLPRRRGRVYDFGEEELETTGRFEPRQPEQPAMSVRVTETGAASVVNADGTTAGLPYPDETHGLPFFNRVRLSEFPGIDHEDGLVVGKAQKPDGSWHYAVLHLETGLVMGPVERGALTVDLGTDPGDFLDLGLRPPGIDELEHDFPAHFLGAWQAPAPAFGYDQEVRILDRPHTEEVAGTVGAVVAEVLHDDLTWGYYIALNADPYQSATVAEEDLEPTGNFGEGYNPPPGWLG